MKVTHPLYSIFQDVKAPQRSIKKKHTIVQEPEVSTVSLLALIIGRAQRSSQRKGRQ